MLKQAIAYAVRPAARAYIRYAPWSQGKAAVYGLYNRYIAWRTHVAKVRTGCAKSMELQMPDFVSTTLYLTGRWEALITRYIQATLQRGETFVDVGANIGYYCLLASRIVGPAGRVFAIEASPSIYARLVRNITLNDRTNITAIHAAASDVKGEASIFFGPPDNLGHSTTVARLAQKEGQRLESKVPSDTLDALVGVQALRSARFIKIDVEGAECAVLAPLFATLGEFSASSEWLLELSADFCPGGQDDVDRIFSAFLSHGYRAYAIQNKYDPAFLLNPPSRIRLAPLTSAPSAGVCDVLMSRRPGVIQDFPP